MEEYELIDSDIGRLMDRMTAIIVAYVNAHHVSAVETTVNHKEGDWHGRLSISYKFK